jgi:methionyl-tRNA formyltransferase
MIVWDLLTAEQVHNRIRALTAPYPGAYTFWSGCRVQLWKSRLSQRLFFGEPGRIYECTTRGFLVCALDRCLWIEEATLDKADARKQIKRYDRFVSVRDAVAHWAATRSE